MAYFRFEIDIRELNCSLSDGEELEFRLSRPVPIMVCFKRRNEQKADIPGEGQAVCIATVEREIEPEVKAELARCIEESYIDYRKLNPKVLEDVDNIIEQIKTVSQTTIAIFNWRHGLDVSPGPFAHHRQAFYSEDGESWFSIPQTRRLFFVSEQGKATLRPNQVKREEIASKVETGAEEPLGRQIFREAWSQRNTNPRGALVIGVAAAEVGVKRLVGKLIPAASWLMEEVQAPPVRKILRDFLPTLPIKAKRCDGGSMSVPPKLISDIHKAVEYRNRVVHRGEAAPGKQELINMLQAISDLLWICDIYQGDHWAIEHVSYETRKDWGAQSE